MNQPQLINTHLWSFAYDGGPFSNSIAESHAQDLRNRLVEKRQRATSPKKIERLNIRIDRVTAMLAAIKLGNP